MESRAVLLYSPPDHLAITWLGKLLAQDYEIGILPPLSPTPMRLFCFQGLIGVAR
jgi:hypothetical protein